MKAVMKLQDLDWLTNCQLSSELIHHKIELCNKLVSTAMCR